MKTLGISNVVMFSVLYALIGQTSGGGGFDCGSGPSGGGGGSYRDAPPNWSPPYVRCESAAGSTTVLLFYRPDTNFSIRDSIIAEGVLTIDKEEWAWYPYSDTPPPGYNRLSGRLRLFGRIDPIEGSHDFCFASSVQINRHEERINLMWGYVDGPFLGMEVRCPASIMGDLKFTPGDTAQSARTDSVWVGECRFRLANGGPVTWANVELHRLRH
jgi:hypothetical protein